jgi:transcriptional regulator with XRE-family HTH domain
MSRTTFSSYERDTQRPSVDVLPAIADFLEVSIDQVLVLFGASAIAAARTALGRLSASAAPPRSDTDIHNSDVSTHSDSVIAPDDFADGYAGNNDGSSPDEVADLSPYRPTVSIDVTPESHVKADDDREKGKKKKKKKGKREKLVSPAFATHV